MDLQETDSGLALTEVDRKSPRMPPWAGKLFKAYATSGKISSACEAAGVSKQAHFKQLKNNPAYLTAFEEIRIEAGWVFEDLLVQRVLDGEYDFQAHHVLLKRFLPEAYRDRASVEVSGSVDLAIALAQARSRMVVIDADTDTRKAG